MKPKRLKNGIGALLNIRRLQTSTDLLITKSTFQRVTREITNKLSPSYRMQSAAVGALQEATEKFLVDIFELANIAAIHAKRVTINNRDFKLALRISGALK